MAARGASRHLWGACNQPLSGSAALLLPGRFFAEQNPQLLRGNLQLQRSPGGYQHSIFQEIPPPRVGFGFAQLQPAGVSPFR